MKLIKLTVIFSIFCSTSKLAAAQGFYINGKVTGLKDSTLLFLRLPGAEKDADSAMITNGGSFHFSGKLNETTEEAILHTKKFDNYVFFWLENKAISINLKAGEFKKGVIKGSATEDEDHELIVLEMPVTNKEDSLLSALKVTKDTAIRHSLDDKMSALRMEEMTVDISFVKSHPGSIVSANVLSVYSTTWDKETVANLYKNLSPQMKQTSFGINVNNFLLLNKSVNIGDKFTDFELTDTKGNKIKLSDIKGKYILLDFWASWCGPCREENPSLVKSYTLFKDKGFAVFGVSLDDSKDPWLKAVIEDKLAWENVCEFNGRYSKAALIYGINGIPDNFLIDANGIIIARNLRGEDLDKKLHELLP